MMRRAPIWVSLPALLCAAPALAAGGQIIGGEHADFSRIVLPVDPSTEWSLETTEDQVILSFPKEELDFTTNGVFSKMPRSRIAEIATQSGDGRSRIIIDKACDCRVSTTYVKARFLALDLHDRSNADNTAQDTNQHDPSAAAVATTDVAHAGDIPPDVLLAPGSHVVPTDDQPDHAASEPGDHADHTQPEANETALAQIDPAHAPGAAPDPDQEQTEAEAVFFAEEVLLRQIQRAAGQGIISLADKRDSGKDSLEEDYEAISKSKPPKAPAKPETHEVAPLVPLSSSGHARPEDELAALLEDAQIEAATVYDRFSKRAADRLSSGPAPLECISDDKMEVEFWSDGRPFHEQAADLRRYIVGEFDRPDIHNLIELARVYIHFGLGLEAESLLNSFDLQTPNKSLLIDMARVVEGRPVSKYGPLSRQSACPGQHGLWLAAGGGAAAFHDEEHFYTVQEAFAELPIDLRLLIAPQLISNLVKAERPVEAQLISDIVARADTRVTPELELAKARLGALKGQPEEAISTMAHLIEDNAPNAIDILQDMVALAIEHEYKVPDRTITDLRGSIVQYKKTEREPVLRELLARALAGREELGSAISEIRDAKRVVQFPDEFDTVAVDIMAQATPETIGEATYARIILGSTDLITDAPENDPARKTIAKHLLALGLPKAAAVISLPAAERDEPARLVLAQSYIDQNNPIRAREILAHLDSIDAAMLRAHSFTIEGEYARAQGVLDEAGLTDEAATIAWKSGNWPVASEIEEGRNRTAMADYMAARSGESPAPEPSENPEELEAADAFVEPLPHLDQPSLNAARRLLATGAQVEDFVESLLDEHNAKANQ